ncbi:MAG: lipopolysaccharide kinase InaA family protein [Phycisphaerales bacterium]
MDTGFDPAWTDTIEPAEVYKHDARSRVWRIDAPDGRSFVIKRFEFNPIRQALGQLLRVHPGMREIKQTRLLIDRGIPVVPIVASGTQRRGGGVFFWLATPYVGKSVFNLLYHGDLSDAERRAAVLDGVGRLTGELIAEGFFNRDHKASNILIDAEGKPLLIDCGAVRWHGGKTDSRRMLTNLTANLAEAGATDADLDRVVWASETNPG